MLYIIEKRSKFAVNLLISGNNENNKISNSNGDYSYFSGFMQGEKVSWIR